MISVNPDIPTVRAEDWSLCRCMIQIYMNPVVALNSAHGFTPLEAIWASNGKAHTGH